jgi:circadian clock protein KaiB
MGAASKKGASALPGVRERTLFRLYIADKTPNSARAVANLQTICQEHLQGRYRLEVVDILQEPLRALSEGVLVTPTLVRLSPPPLQKIVGDLSDRNAVLHALGLEGGAE